MTMCCVSPSAAWLKHSVFKRCLCRLDTAEELSTWEQLITTIKVVQKTIGELDKSVCGCAQE